MLLMMRAALVMPPNFTTSVPAMIGNIQATSRAPLNTTLAAVEQRLVPLWKLGEAPHARGHATALYRGA
jgi:hypothetical protein